VTGTVAYQLKEASLGGNNLNANLIYRDGPVVLAAAAARVRHSPGSASPALYEEDLFMLGGAYDFKVARLFAQYSVVNKDLAGTKDKLPHVGITVPLGVGEIQAAWAKDTTTGTTRATRTTTSAGYVHHLSKRTNLYGFVASDKLRVGTATSYVIGVRHSF